MTFNRTVMKYVALSGFLFAIGAGNAQACRQGYVWREASGPNDIVCVTPVERSIGQVQNQNYPTADTCPAGLVWREATLNDHRCVTPEERSLAAAQNQVVRDRN